MIRFKRVAVLLFSGLASAVAFGQAPPPPSSSTSASKPAAAEDKASRDAAYYRRRSVVQHYPYPYPGYYHGEDSAGWRNPGNTGRYLEYYPPGNQFQVSGAVDPVRPARFDTGGGAPNRAEQLQAQQIGISRYNSIQGHIDNMARPTYGYGFGVGYFGGYY